MGFEATVNNKGYEFAQNEKVQQDNYARIVEMINLCPTGIKILELDSTDIVGTLRSIYYNDWFFSYSGCTREEYAAILEQNEYAFVLPEDASVYREAIKSICAGAVGFSIEWEARCRTKTNGYRWLLLTGQLYAKHNNLCTIILSMVDITQRKEAEDKQRVSEELLRIAAETDKRSLIIYDVKANTCQVESRTLYAEHYGEIIGDIPQRLIDLKVVAEESISELSSLFERIRAGEERVTVKLKLSTAVDEYQWFECNAKTVFDADSKPDCAVLVFHNITEQLIKEAVFKKWQQSIEVRPQDSFTLFRCNLSKDASIDEREGTLLKVEFSADEMTFNSRTLFYAQQFVYAEDREAYIALLDADALLSKYYRGERMATMEYRELSVNDEVVWRRLTVELVEYINSEDIQAFILYEDIDEAKQEELRAKEIAETDPLTGVLNRAAFAQRVDAIIQDLPSAQNAIFMLDMDGFKQINDTFGHAAGDQALQNVVAVLHSYIRKGDLVCRFGGDEFLVMLRDMPYEAVVGRIAKQICEHILKAYSRDVRLSASIGIAIYPRDGQDFDELYQNADRALYKVKQSGKGSYAFFSASEEVQVAAVEEAYAEIRQAPQSPCGIKRRMMIVDTDEVNRVMLKKMFEQDFTIEIAKTGVEAMMRMRHFGQAISVVLMSADMRGMGGLAVLKKMQNSVEARAIPVIIVCASEKRDTILKAIELGAADYVTMPIDAEFIRMRVQSAISKAENERLRAQNSYLQLQRDEEIKYRTILDSTGTVVVEYDWRTHVFIYDSEISKYIAGTYDHRGLWQVLLADMVADSIDVKTLQDAMIALANRGQQQYEKLIMLKTPAKIKHWFRVNIYKREDEFGLAERLLLTFNDVHDEVKKSEKLLFQATRDELTGIYNRVGFVEKAAELIAKKEPGYYVLACIDIENFKVINDQNGMDKGDEVLRHFADTLSGYYHDEFGVCCRAFADNFAVLYPAALLNTVTLADSHREIANVKGLPTAVKFYIGRCLVDDKSLPVDVLYSRAVIAKSTIKGRYDTFVAIYDETMRTSLLRQQEITGQMQYALDNGQFEVWLQPQFNHATGKLSGAEALVRWRHPKEGIIAPGEFIPIFERNGFVYEVDKYVWEETCRLLRRWLDEGLHPVPISVNVSRYDVFRPDLIATIVGLVKRYDIPVDLLRLEVTESAFTESTDQIISVIKSLVKLGFIVEIDDFGSGYSSLNTLKDVPAQVIKMDMRFLENDANAQRGGSIIESVVRMSRWLGMAVIAEGVETMEQADYLKSIGCDYIQGYLYSKPTQVCDYEKLFEAGAIENKLSQLEAVDTWNNNAFWNPKSMETLIFNSYVGGACIFEYYNGKTELLRYNVAYAEIFGSNFKHEYTSEHNDFLAVLNPENAGIFRNGLTRAIQTKREVSSEFQLVSDDKRVSLYITITYRQIAQAGERYLFYCVVNDNTKLREAQQKESNISRQMDTIMRHIDGGITATVYRDENNVEIIFANDGFYELYGYTKEQMKTEVANVLDLILPEDRKRVMDSVAHILRTRGSETYEYRCYKRDGSIMWTQSTNTIIAIDGISDPVLLAVSADITVQKNTKFAMKELRKDLLDNLPIGTALLEFDGKNIAVIHISRRYWELVGREPVDYVGTSVFDIFHPDDRQSALKEIKAAIRQHRIGTVIARLAYGMSGYKTFKITTTIKHEANGKYLLYVAFAPI